MIFGTFLFDDGSDPLFTSALSGLVVIGGTITIHATITGTISING